MSIEQKNEKYIPKGYYCYGVRKNLKYKDILYSEDIPFFDYYEKIICPFWKEIEPGRSGCKHLKKISSLEEGYLFWDMVKDCEYENFSETDTEISYGYELISDEKLQLIRSI